jgi:hypothetical protein
VSTVSRDVVLGHLKCIAGDDLEPPLKFSLKLGEGGNAAPVAFDGNDRGTGVEEGAGEPARTRSDLVHALALQIARNASNAREELPVENEILAERLARIQPMT